MKKFTKSLIAMCAICNISLFSASAQFKPEVDLGLLTHMYVKTEQVGYGSYRASDLDSDYAYGIGINHMRIMFDAKITEKDFLFVQTESNAILGTDGEKSASIRILDAMYMHKFSDKVNISAGKILAAYNRNNIQGTAALLTNDFGTFQCEWNSAMQDDAGRSIGVNLGGALLNDKLIYNIGAFLGHKFTDENGEDVGYLDSPLRYIGRLQYDFFDRDKYAGTNLGEGKTLSLGVGFDTQGAYVNGGVDAYFDMPVGALGSLTANLAYAAMTGGDETDKYYVEGLPAKDVYFAELGYYFKDVKLQPWVKYELMSEKHGGMDDTIYGGGLSYFFSGYKANLKLAYSVRENSILNKSYNQVLLALHLFIL